METKDILITPLYLIIFYIGAFVLRPLFSDQSTRKFFIPAISLKFFGAIAVGLIYQFYYRGGDTMIYFYNGSKWIQKAFLDNPISAIRLIVSDGKPIPDLFVYTDRIYNYGDSASYFVVRFAGFADIFTFSTYSSTALFFALFGFAGCWAMFTSIVKYFPNNIKGIAIAVLFLPSLVFWGSGILKDTLTLGGVGFMFYGISNLVDFKTHIKRSVILLILGFFVVYSIKIYILLCFIPAVIVWAFYTFQTRIRSVWIRLAAAPILLAISILLAGYGAMKVGEDNSRYSFEMLQQTAQETASWNYYVSQREQGSGYSLGDYDFSPAGLARKFIPAVGTALFRPFLWEAKNPVMLLSAIENFLFLFLLIKAFRNFKNWRKIISHPVLLFCLIFCVFFAFAVGITTYNFGSLVRYRIPLLPFFLTLLFLLNSKVENFSISK